MSDNSAPFLGMRDEETIEKMKQAMHDKVVGEVEKGDPVEVVVQRAEDRPVRRYLTYYGWFRGPTRSFSGEMEKCAKEEREGEEDILIDLQCNSINPDDVLKIIPLDVREKNGGYD